MKKTIILFMKKFAKGVEVSNLFDKLEYSFSTIIHEIVFGDKKSTPLFIFN